MAIKKILPILCCAVVLFAQDVIIRTDGETIEAIVSLIGEDVIEYKMKSNPDGPTRQISKRNVFMIMFENGTREVFTTPRNENAVKQERKQLPNVYMISQNSIRNQANIFINGELLAENFSSRGKEIDTLKIHLPLGRHNIRAEYSSGEDRVREFVLREGRKILFHIHSNKIEHWRERPIEAEQSHFWLNAKFQQCFERYNPSSVSGINNAEINSALNDAYGKTIPIGNVHVEFGRLIYDKVLLAGIFDVIENQKHLIVGGGVLFGRVISAGEIFKFVPALNLGVWYVETSYNNDRYNFNNQLLSLDWEKDSFLFGGPEARFLIGYRFVFADLGFKCKFGFQRDSFTAITNVPVLGRRTHTEESDPSFKAMFNWNVGLTFLF